MLGVPDAASIAAMRHLDRAFGRRSGPSTGTNLYGALYLACEMAAAGRSGSIVSLVCGGTERYDATVNDDTWLAAQGIDPEPYVDVVERAWTAGSRPGSAREPQPRGCSRPTRSARSMSRAAASRMQTAGSGSRSVRA